MKIINVEHNDQARNNSPYMYKMTILTASGELKTAYAKQQHLNSWLLNYDKEHKFQHFIQNINQLSLDL